VIEKVELFDAAFLGADTKVKSAKRPQANLRPLRAIASFYSVIA